jgi:uncharacterized protein (TIGR03437 family)
VKVAVAGNPAISATFSITVNVTITGLQKLSGDLQSAAANSNFPQPLVVQVNGSTGQPVVNYPVQFIVNGPATTAAPAVNTDSNGRAQITVTAGATGGTVVVTASAAGFSQTFNLTVIPPGPTLTSDSFFNGAGFQRGSISPCGIVTIIATGLAPGVQGVVAPGMFGPLPYQMALGTAGTILRVSFSNSQAPIFSVANVNNQEQVTVQVPCDVTPGSSVPVTVNVGGGSATVNVAVLPASPGIFETLMSDGVRRAVLVRPDGSFVSLENPARREIIRAYVTGMGLTSPALGTNQFPTPGTDANVSGQVIVGVNNAGVRVISARALPDVIGVFEVVFVIDSDSPSGNNVVFSVAVNPISGGPTRFSNGSKIPIQ